MERNVNKMMALIILSILLALSMNFNGVSSSTVQHNNDFELYIEGGIGLTIGAINHGNHTLQVNFTITVGIIRPPMSGEFYVPPGQGHELRIINPFSLPLPITVTLSAKNESITRSGITILIFIIFFD
ncbi:MAG TPA: hypothetical protein ENI33_07320 [Thermoplasmatales archaeon]|nr:hypothetical protein [Thermoplasmatales archaeon]